MDVIAQEDHLELMGFCIASRDQVKSVMLFSKEGWGDLEGKRIGITDGTSTSVQLLKVLLQKKYNIRVHLERLHGGVNDLSGFDAVLLIGDEALQRNKHGLPGFDLVYDLAREWYEWQKLPFVFAVWAIRRSLPAGIKAGLTKSLAAALEAAEEDFVAVGGPHGRQIGLTDAETRDFLAGFNYRLGEREKEAVERFVEYVKDLEKVDLGEKATGRS
jgi:chorismate dehydratase